MAEGKKTKEKEHKITAIAGCLPQELIMDILLRLPAKTLGRFKSVCKSWNSLISTHSFATSHLYGINNPASLLFACRKGFTFPLNFYLKGVCDLVGSSVEIEGDPTPLPLGSSYVMGSSHGLICIQSSNNLIHVLNPTTKECRNISFPRVFQSHIFRCGFGFVPAIDDYKVVLLARCSDPSISSDYRVYVFSLREDQWRELNGCTALDELVDCPLTHSFADAAQVVMWNEAFYWVFCFAQGFSLLKFDIIKERFSRAPNLKQNCGYYEPMASISVTEHNNLCVCQLVSPSSIEMWMLVAEYGDWKLKLRFELQFPAVYLLGSTSNGYVLVQFWDGKKEFILLDTNLVQPTYHLVTEKQFIYVGSFTASLISPHYSRQFIGV